VAFQLSPGPLQLLEDELGLVWLAGKRNFALNLCTPVGKARKQQGMLRLLLVFVGTAQVSALLWLTCWSFSAATWEILIQRVVNI